MRYLIVIILHYFDVVILLCMYAHVCYEMIYVQYENFKIMLLPWTWRLKLNSNYIYLWTWGIFSLLFVIKFKLVMFTLIKK